MGIVLIMKNDVKKWMKEDGQKFLREIGIKKGQTVLDFGCGEGHYTIPLSKVVGKNGKVYALDKDKNVLDKLEKVIKENNIKNVDLINGGLKIPLKGETLDVVLCYDVIHYEIKRQRKSIYREIYRLLKKESLFSVYPKHYKSDYPLMELVDVNLENVVKEIEEEGFILKHKFSKTLLHDDYYNEGYILNLRRN